jgi:hypothetical protein
MEFWAWRKEPATNAAEKRMRFIEEILKIQVKIRKSSARKGKRIAGG